MKLLIDMDDEDYYDLIEKSKRYPIDMFTKAQSSIINGKPLDSVLDEIKTEIEDYESDCNYHLSEEDNCRTCNKITFGSIYRIIDKHRKESDGK